MRKHEDFGLCRPLHDLLSRGRQLNGNRTSRLRSMNSIVQTENTALLAQADDSRAQGRLSRTSAKRVEIRRTRGAFHR